VFQNFDLCVSSKSVDIAANAAEPFSQNFLWLFHSELVIVHSRAVVLLSDQKIWEKYCFKLEVNVSVVERFFVAWGIGMSSGLYLGLMHNIFVVYISRSVHLTSHVTDSGGPPLRFQPQGVF
jgi:hypothetical protein